MLQQTQLVIAERDRLHFCWGQPGSGDGTDGSRAAIDCGDWNHKSQLGWYLPDLTNSFCFGSEDFIQERGRRFVTESGTCMKPVTLWSPVWRCNHWQYTCTCYWQFSYMCVNSDSGARQPSQGQIPNGLQLVTHGHLHLLLTTCWAIFGLVI